MKTERKRFSYGAGAIAVLAISLGVALIIYGLGLVAFDFLNLLGWIFGPLGVYTVVYSFMTKSQSTYYLVWGTIMVAVAIIGGFYNVVPWYLVLGILVIVLAVIGVIAYMEGKN
ncbi:MAG TPA: hypothetical protein VMT06_00785 [Candidatus Eisenbacteria bacterium]|nr:hypothetical protein [Candidatus Eisenbacteria bacterium]